MSKGVFKAILLTIVCGVSAFAQKGNQGKPNFNGTWILVEATDGDKKVESNNEIAGRLVIEKQGSEFKLIEKQIITPDDNGKNSRMSVFYTDKRGENNVNRQARTVETKTWEKNGKVVITEALRKPEFEIYLVTAYSLSKNGNELTVKIFPFADPSNTLNKDVYDPLPAESKRVYRKISE